VFDCDETLLIRVEGGRPVDARAVVESCLRAGCAVGIATGNVFCDDANSCDITRKAFGFNILVEAEVAQAAKTLGLSKIVTGKDWVINRQQDKSKSLATLAERFPQHSAVRILFDDNPYSCSNKKILPPEWTSQADRKLAPQQVFACDGVSGTPYSRTLSTPGTFFIWAAARDPDSLREFAADARIRIAPPKHSGISAKVFDAVRPQINRAVWAKFPDFKLSAVPSPKLKKST